METNIRNPNNTVRALLLHRLKVLIPPASIILDKIIKAKITLGILDDLVEISDGKLIANY